MRNAPVICNHDPLGAGNSGDIAGLNCRVLTSALSPQCRGIAGVLIPVPKWPWKFTFTCWDLIGDFGRALTIRVSLQCWAYTRALKREKSISPLFPGPEGDVVANDWCIRHCVL